MTDCEGYPIPKEFRRWLDEEEARIDEHNVENGPLICDRCDREVTVAGFEFLGPYDDPPMATFCNDCMRPDDQVMNVVITWKAGEAEAQWKKCRELKPAFRPQE